MLWNVLCVSFLCGFLQTLAKESKGHISVVLVGATGDLAKKYLWQGFFHLYANQVSSGHSFSFYGAALAGPEDGTPSMFQTLKGLTCLSGVTPDRCALLKDQFLKLSQYRQLKSAENYTVLDNEIEKLLKDEGLQEAGRLFYLSVPPFAYADIAKNINSTCRPMAGAWLRVVFEKPFGHDYEAAKKLAKELGMYFQEEEMYRVDHYLGKQAVAHILPFRHDNREFLDPIWNQHHVERVEIVLKETVSAKGRTSFYEKYGVIRDMMQNHLTEILLFVGMETPLTINSSKEVLQNKLRVFESLRKLDKESAVIGQYQNYSAEVTDELQETKGFKTLTPTFAGVLVHIDNLQWDGVPFILTSGKVLDERAGYVRILFKNGAFCLQSENGRKSENSQCKLKQIIFYVGHGDLKFPAILVSKNLFKPLMPALSWKEVTEYPDISLFGQPLSDYYIYSPVIETEAYTLLISHIFQAKHESFITTENLLASWSFWTPLLNSLANEYPRLYPGGAENKNLLDFVVTGNQVGFTLEAPVKLFYNEPLNSAAENAKVIQSVFRKSKLVSAWAKELIERLASQLYEAAKEAVKRSGKFHLALSGGSSPVILFHRLAFHYYRFPWKQTHFWMVDERCVPFTDQESNFKSLHDNLLQNLKVPYFNIHPMPVYLNQRLCVEEDSGPEFYSSEISRLVNNASFDFVLLGTGEDGHTASLFRSSEATFEGDKFVTLTESPIKPHQRMSFSLSLINKAKEVAVLIMGYRKHNIVNLISKVAHEPEKWPITGVQPNNGRLVWYIDYEALLG
ncbi:GDH/6PGL endoplasmic bifunctional protein [Latimeria chalumnae]